MDRMLLPTFTVWMAQLNTSVLQTGRSPRLSYGHDGVTHKGRLRSTRTLQFEKTHTDGAGYTGCLTDLIRIRSESLSNGQVIQRSLDEETSIEPQG